jgi:L-lactate dehydrogenase (cytochrome)
MYKYAGRDATKPYSAIHAPSIIKEGLPSNAFKGILDTATVTEAWSNPLEDETPKAAPNSSSEKPPLESLINTEDFELVARNTSTPKTWAFYSSADTGLVTRDANKSLYSRVWFRPRTMRNVTQVSTESSILGLPVALPLMVSPAAMARLIHPDGELAIARACANKGIIQCISTSASYSAIDIASTTPKHPFIFQLYVDRQRHKSEALLRKLHENAKNIRAIYVTVDAAAAGKREADERVKADESLSSPMVNNKAKNDKKGGGLGRIMGNFIDPGLCWDDIKWLRKQTNLPLLLKGVMSADDVKMALDHGLEGVMLSNHGGRNLDTAPPALLVLLECHKRFPEIFTAEQDKGKKFEIHIDGGIRRGGDILKCLCLGVTGVGIGRSFLYATGYGQEGVEHLIDILHDELRIAMSNCGITRIEDAGPHMVNTGDVDHLVPGSRLHPYVKDWRRAKL